MGQADTTILLITGSSSLHNPGKPVPEWFKPIWILMNQDMMGGSSISWTICKSIAPPSRRITTPAPHHSIFTSQMLFVVCNKQCQSGKSLGSEV